LNFILAIRLLDQPEISLPVSRPFNTVSRRRFAFFAFDLRHNGRAKAKATANKVTATKIGAQIPSDNTDKAISGNSLTRGATLVAKRLYRDFFSSAV
jgi:hypothetical protein